jgi:hypothetical protein
VNAEVEDLAGPFEVANQEAIAFAEACTDGQWTAMVEGEGWPVGVVVHHIAAGHLLMLDWLGRASRGEAITKTASEIDADNARHARAFAGVGRADTVGELRRHGALLAHFIRGLTADELDTSVPFGPADGRAFTTRQLVSAAAGHCRTHLADARGALEEGPC